MGRAYPRRTVKRSGPKKKQANMEYKCTQCGSVVHRTLDMPLGKKYASPVSYQKLDPSHCPHCREEHPSTCACKGCKTERARQQ